MILVVEDDPKKKEKNYFSTLSFFLHLLPIPPFHRLSFHLLFRSVTSFALKKDETSCSGTTRGQLVTTGDLPGRTVGKSRGEWSLHTNLSRVGFYYGLDFSSRHSSRRDVCHDEGISN